MKTVKIIIGLLLLYGASTEYIQASRELHSFYDPAIITATLLFLVVGAWLIGSGISNQKLPIRSLQFLKYLGISTGIFLFVAFFNFINALPGNEVIEVNSMHVNIGRFMKGTEKIIPNEQQRRQWCICIVTKLTADKNLVKQHKAELESGNYAQLLKDVMNGPDAEKYGLNECYSTITNLQWTPVFEKGVRSSIIKRLNETNVSSTNDIDKYCDCLVDEYKKLTIHELSSQGFADSDKGMLIDSLCNSRSKKNK